MSYISNFEDTGLNKAERFLCETLNEDFFNTERSYLSGTAKKMLSEILSPYNVSFILEEGNRMQSTLLCELGLSYVQQSQRYVEMKNNFDIPEVDAEEQNIVNSYKKLCNKAFDLYTRMSEKTGEFKGRPKIENYKNGIPIEDARYILPLATKTNIIVSCNASKLIDLFELFNDIDYFSLFKDLYHDLKAKLPHKIGALLSICIKDVSICNVERYYNNFYNLVSPNYPVYLLNDFSDSKERVALAAWTSSSGKTASQLQELYKDNMEEKADAVINRVIGYGHKAIIEHSRNTFVQEMSLVTYHQFIRHRLTTNHREPFENLITMSHDFIIPDTIRNSEFAKEYSELVKEIVTFRKTIPYQFKYLLLLNCEAIRVVSSSNARIDCENMVERICLTAQWEIRKLYTERFDILYAKYPEFYKFALPPCIYGICKEGKMTCGKAKEIKEKYSKE